MKKTSVPTWKLLMSAMSLFPEDIFSREESVKVDCFYQDLFTKNSVMETINQECAPQIVFAAQTLQNWQKQNCITICRHQEAKDKVLALIAEKQLPETVEIPAVRSLWSFWGLYCELNCIPGRPLEDIIAMFKQDYPGVPEPMLAEVVCRSSGGYSLAQSAFDMRDWVYEHPQPAGAVEKARWAAEFNHVGRLIRLKYGLPEYLG